jgi:LysM repeat protein
MPSVTSVRTNPIVPTTGPVQGGPVTVAAGDSLSKIAARLGVSQRVFRSER